MEEVSQRRIVIPGDIVQEISEEGEQSSKAAVILGPGLMRAEGATVRVCRPGLLRSKEAKNDTAATFYWVDSHSRYAAYIRTYVRTSFAQFCFAEMTKRKIIRRRLKSYASHPQKLFFGYGFHLHMKLDIFFRDSNYSQ